MPIDVEDLGEVDQRQELVMRAVLPLHSFYRCQDNVAFIMDINRELSGVALLVAGWVRKTHYPRQPTACYRKKSIPDFS